MPISEQLFDATLAFTVDTFGAKITPQSDAVGESPAHPVTIFRYLVVGVTAFVFDLVLFLLFFRVIGADYRLANAIGLVGGFFLSFLLNRRFTFAGRGGGVAANFLRFAAANLLSLILATLLLWVLVQTVGWRTEVAKVVVSMLVPACNYVLYRQFVFAGR